MHHQGTEQAEIEHPDLLHRRPGQAAKEPAVVRARAVEPGSFDVGAMIRLQRSVGNRAVADAVDRSAPARSPVVESSVVAQRGHFTEGGKNGVAIPESVRAIANWVLRDWVKPGHRNHLPDIQGRGFPGFKKGKNEHAGGRVFDNKSMPDRHRLPTGHTYQEWDTEPVLPGNARGPGRIVTSSSGHCYYSANHYTDFTELKR